MNRPRTPTPGPWRYELGIVYGCAEDGEGDVVADNVGTRDGPLVAAAPELAEALESMIAFMLEVFYDASDAGCEIATSDAVMAKARAALAKAGR